MRRPPEGCLRGSAYRAQRAFRGQFFDTVAVVLLCSFQPAAAHVASDCLARAGERRLSGGLAPRGACLQSQQGEPAALGFSGGRVRAGLGRLGGQAFGLDLEVLALLGCLGLVPLVELVLGFQVLGARDALVRTSGEGFCFDLASQVMGGLGLGGSAARRVCRFGGGFGAGFGLGRGSIGLTRMGGCVVGGLGCLLRVSGGGIGRIPGLARGGRRLPCQGFGREGRAVRFPGVPASCGCGLASLGGAAVRLVDVAAGLLGGRGGIVGVATGAQGSERGIPCGGRRDTSLVGGVGGQMSTLGGGPRPSAA